MASRKEIERLEDENRTLCQRLSSVEVELGRKEDALKSATLRKTEMINDIREYQRKVKDLSMQLEKTENGELEARASEHDTRQALEQAETDLRDHVASSKSAINSLQLEIKDLKTKLANKEEQFLEAREQLYHKDEEISTLVGERSRLDKDGSSRLANLNQALMQAKQSCAQLTDENTTLRENGKQLSESYEMLKCKYDALVASKTSGESQHETVVPKTNQPHLPATPLKPIPSETEAETLKIENSKLKQEFQCLQTNFQLTSAKSMQLKKVVKDLEESLDKLQCAYDRAVEEKEELQKACEDARTSLANRMASTGHRCQGCTETEKELSVARSELDTLQQQYFDLQDKLKAEMAQTLETQDTIDGLDAQIRNLQAEKSSVKVELSAAQQKLRELEEQLSLYQQSQDCQSELQRQSTQAMSAFEHKISSLKHENEYLQEQLARASEELDDLRSRLSSLEETNKNLQLKSDGLEIENRQLSAQLRASGGSQTEELLRRHLAELSEDNGSLSARNKELEEITRRLRLNSQELEKAKSRLQREANHHWELVKKLQKELENQESCSFMVEAQLKDRAQLVSKLEQEMGELKLEHEVVVNAKQMYEIEVSRLMGKLEELEQANFELSSRAAEFESATSSAKATQSEDRAKLQEMEGKLGTTRTTLVETELQVMDLRNTNELMEKENSSLLSQVNSLTAMVTARNGKIESLQSQIVRFESDSADIAARISDLEDSHSHCATVKQELEQEIDNLKDSLESTKAAHRQSESLTLTYKLELKQLQDYNNSLESVNLDLQEKMKAEIAAAEELGAKTQDMERDQKEIAKESRMKAASLTSALEEMDYMKRCSEEAQQALRREIEAQELKYSELGATCNALRRDKSEMVSELAQARNEIRELQSLLSTSKSESRCLLRRIDHAKQEASGNKEKLMATEQDLKCQEFELRQIKQQLTNLEKEALASKQEKTRSTEQYVKLKTSMITLLESSTTGEPVAASQSEATPTKKTLKGILKNSGTLTPILKPVQNKEN